MEYKRTCPICGNEFTAKNSRGVFCSEKCRVRAFRRAHGLVCDDADVYEIRNRRPILPEPRKVTVDNIAEAVARTKGDSTAFRCYATACEPAMAARLVRIADAIDAAMAEVGL